MASKKPINANMISVEFLEDYIDGNKKKGDKIEMPKGLFNFLSKVKIVKEISDIPKKPVHEEKKRK